MGRRRSLLVFPFALPQFFYLSGGDLGRCLIFPTSLKFGLFQFVEPHFVDLIFGFEHGCLQMQTVDVGCGKVCANTVPLAAPLCVVVTSLTSVSCSVRGYFLVASTSP